ncbi:MAG: DUF420 domain-containing protein [Planctomycetaceae bacterium]
MSDGFLGNDASLMLDAVVCMLLLVVPVLGHSVYVVKARRAYVLHRNLQIAIGVGLLMAITAFEVDLQLVHGGWLNVVNKNPDAPRLTGDRLAEVRLLLRVHLAFAVSTPVLWVVTTVLALKRFPNPPQPGPHSRLHKSLGWLSVADLVLTTITGLAFYYAAFVRR